MPDGPPELRLPAREDVRESTAKATRRFKAGWEVRLRVNGLRASQLPPAQCFFEGAHQGTQLEVELSEKSDHVRVEVTDPGEGFERPQRPVPDLTRTGGLGLVLVDRLSRAWGTGRTPKGALVWFELAHDPREWHSEVNPA